MKLHDVDVFFAFSSCMSEEILLSLAQSLGRQVKTGAYIITTDYALPLQGIVPQSQVVDDLDAIPYGGQFQFEIVDVIDGDCSITGGISTAYIHLVTKSMYDGKTKQKPQKSLQDEAYSIVTDMERGTLTDTDAFRRNVYNTMVFNGLPEE